MVDFVEDGEMLYRSVRSDHTEEEGNSRRASSQAFADRSQRISFNRARLRSAEETRFSPDQAVFAVTAREVRGIKGIITGATTREVEVYFSPLSENTSHCHVSPSDPEGHETVLPKSGFDRLKREIAKIAVLVLPPG